MQKAARALIEDFAVHGGRLDQARAASPHIGEWTDLSTGIAPWAYPIGPIAHSAERLPDPSALGALEAAAAATFGASASHVVAVPGSDLGLRMLGTILPGRAAIVRPGYSGHAAMWAERPVTACAPDAILAAAETHDALVLARPNNPDGWTAERGQLRSAAAALASRGGHLIVDEAFADATPADAVAGLDWPGTIVLRSFGKFFGLAGLRLGFVIAPLEICQKLRQLIGDWPVAGPTVAAGLAAYRDTDWQAEQRARLAASSHRMAETLRGHGISIVGGTDFFTLVEVPGRDALFETLAQAGVLTRPFASAPDRLRLGLPRRDSDWTRLTWALTEWRQR